MSRERCTLQQTLPQTEDFIIVSSATRPFSTIQFSDGTSSLQTLLRADFTAGLSRGDFIIYKSMNHIIYIIIDVC